jgi:sulfoxide reductase heme-binding subunit YedZ
LLSDRALRFGLKPIVFLASLGPFFYLIWAAYTGNLSANPLSDLTNETGVWTLRFVCITLAITPVRKLTGWNPLVKFRRMAGLFAFFYGTLHLMTYAIADRFAGLDQAGSWVEALSAGHLPGAALIASTLSALAKSIGEDIYKRPFITVGFAAWLTMLPLAITSTAGWIRRLGGKRWNRLHRLVYLTGILGPLHYWWLVKADINRPLTYAAVVAVLLGARVYLSRARQRVVVPARTAVQRP